MKIKTRHFNSFEAFEESGISGEWETVAIVTENGRICADLMTECKSWKTALRRFFKAVEAVPELAEWAEGLRESCENGCFSDRARVWDGGKLTNTGDWAYSVEDCDGAWYVSLIVRTEASEEPAPAPAPVEVCAECVETGERLEGSARAVYGALRFMRRLARRYGDPVGTWRTVPTASDPGGCVGVRVIYAAIVDSRREAL